MASLHQREHLPRCHWSGRRHALRLRGPLLLLGCLNRRAVLWTPLHESQGPPVGKQTAGTQLVGAAPRHPACPADGLPRRFPLSTPLLPEQLPGQPRCYFPHQYSPLRPSKRRCCRGDRHSRCARRQRAPAATRRALPAAAVAAPPGGALRTPTGSQPLAGTNNPANILDDTSTQRHLER